MREDRLWMYTGRHVDGFLTDAFVSGVEEFLDFAFGHEEGEIVSGGKIRCPCSRCQNRKYLGRERVAEHLFRKGFVVGYDNWYLHGEAYVPEEPSSSRFSVGVGWSGDLTGGEYINPTFGLMPGESSGQYHETGVGMTNTFQTMVMDAGGPNWGRWDILEEPNPQAKQLYDLLEAAQQELYAGSSQSQLSVVARLLSIKSDYSLSEGCYDRIAELIGDCLPEGNHMVHDFYETKRLIAGLGLPVETIDCCWNNCMLYWSEDSELDACKFCGHPRYKE